MKEHEHKWKEVDSNVSYHARFFTASFRKVVYILRCDICGDYKKVEMTL